MSKITNKADLGKVAITVASAPWNANTKYEKLTQVFLDGDSYVSLKDNKNVNPSTDTTGTWAKSTAHGKSLYELLNEKGLYDGTEEEFLAEWNKRAVDIDKDLKDFDDLNKEFKKTETIVKNTVDNANTAIHEAGEATNFANSAAINAEAATARANTAAANAEGIKTSLDNFIAQGGGATDTQVIKNTEDIATLGSNISELGQQVIYDVTKNNSGAKFASLSALLSSENLSTLIPSTVRCGGMSIRFVQSSDNKYVQCRYMGTATTGTPNPFLDTANWQEENEVLFTNVNAVVGDFSTFFTLSTAIAAIPSEKRRNGMFIVYRSGESNYEFAQYLKAGNLADTNWLNTDNWKKIDDKSEIYSLLSTINNNIDYLNAGNSFNSNLKAITPTPESGKFIDKNGNTGESNVYDKVTINLKRGEFFVGRYVASINISAIALVIDENTYKPIVIGEDSTNQKYYSYLATEQVSIVVSYRNSLSYLFYKTISEVTDSLTLNGTSKVNATSWARSKYIDTHGQIQDNSSFSIGYLSLNKGDEIIVETEASSSICTIGLVDNNTITPLVFGSNGSIYCLYKYIAPDNINIVVCGRYSANGDHVINLYKKNVQDVVQLVEQANTRIDGEVTKIINEVSPIVYDKSVLYNITGGSYVDYTGTVQSGVSSYSMTSQIQVNAGETIIVKCSASDGCATISIYDEETETYKVITRGTGGIACQNYTPVRDSKIVISFRNTYDHYIYLSERTIYSESLIESKYLKDLDYIKFAKKILFIGDSVTEGAVADYPRTTGTIAEVVPSMSYPVQFERITGVQCVNGGRSGYSAKDWYDNKINEYIYTEYNLCIIELGYNDGLEDTLDTDVIPYTDYRDYADSQCGNYCKIIGRIKEDNPNIMIVLVISPGTTFVREEVPATVKHIANLFSLPYIDLRPNLLVDLNDNKYHGLVNGGNRDMIHFNPIGYMTKAVLVNKLLSQTLSDNLAALNNSVPIPSE